MFASLPWIPWVKYADVVPTSRRADVFYFICCPRATKEIRDLYAGYARRFSKFLRSKVKKVLFAGLSMIELTDLVRLPDRSLPIELFGCVCGALESVRE